MSNLPPYNPEAEEAVCGSLLIGGSLTAANGLSPQDFFTDQHRSIYEACAQLSERGVSINQITVAQKLAETGKLEKVGGASYLSHLISICPTSLDLPHYAAIVKRLSTYRQMVDAGGRIAQIGFKTDADVANSLNEIDELLLSIRKHAQTNEIVTPQAQADLMLTRYEELWKGPGAGISTGLVNLDRAIGGFFPGNLTLIGAVTGYGKTALMRFFTRKIGLMKNVFYASLEMPKEDIMDLEVAAYLGIHPDIIRRGRYSDDLFQRIVAATSEISERRVFLMDMADMGGKATTQDIYRLADTIKTRHGLDILFVDYLTMLQDKGENQNIRLGNIVNSLKGIAMALKIPVVVAVQFNRGIGNREDKRPTIYDIRESGNIEIAADNIILIYWDKEKDDGQVELIVGKKRMGGNPAADLIACCQYDPKHQTYKALNHEPEGEQGEFDG